MSARLVSPIFHNWQRRPYYKNPGPILRYMTRLSVSYYPFSPTNTSMREFIHRVNTNQQKEHTEKKFQFIENISNFGTKSSIKAEYRNGDVLELETEAYSVDEILFKLMAKRLDLEDQLEWAECHTLLTLEEEALRGAAKSEDSASSKKAAAKKPAGKGGAKPAGKPQAKKK
eukprot:TRINITY_DN3380_c0_g2_i8.p1 TRINITY_DN3380_c0_g2~~TRINITY_DN3380_c0_g2_i8.p1  ORF type:complete len:172 (+),score=38.84 TRINITY_DN3380_c0_g2_i8:326-841(+)